MPLPMMAMAQQCRRLQGARWRALSARASEFASDASFVITFFRVWLSALRYWANARRVAEASCEVYLKEDIKFIIIKHTIIHQHQTVEISSSRCNATAACCCAAPARLVGDWQAHRFMRHPVLVHLAENASGMLHHGYQLRHGRVPLDMSVLR